MTILLSQAVRVGGAVLAAGTTQTLEASLEADLITRKMATYTVSPQRASVQLSGEFDPITGEIEIIGPDGEPISVGGGSPTATGWASWGPPSNGTQNASYNFKTAQLNIAAPKRFFAVRLAFRNHSLTNALPLTAGVASAPTLTNNGSALNYQAVKFGGATSTTIPVATSVAGRTEPSVVYSDTIYLASVARTDDTSKPPVLSVRLVHDASNCVFYVPQDTSLASFIASGMEVAGGFHASTGDNTTGSGKTVTVGSSGSVIVPCVEVQFFVGGNSTPVHIFGDSLTADQNLQNYLLKELKSLNPTNPLYTSVYGIGGDKRESTSGAIRNVFDAAPDWAKKGIAVIWNYSVNGTGAGYSQMAVLTDDITYLTSKGLRVVMLTMHGGSSGVNAPPQDEYVELFGSAVTVVDIASILETDGAGVINAEYTSDGTHLTAAGYAAIAPSIAAALDKLR